MKNHEPWYDKEHQDKCMKLKDMDELDQEKCVRKWDG